MNNLNLKKIFFLSLILLVLVGGTFLVYNLFFKNTKLLPSQNDTKNTSLPAGGLGTTDGKNNPNSTNAPREGKTSLKLKPISQEKVIAPTLTSDGQKVKYYIQNGQVLETDFNGLETKKISEKTLNGLLKIIWSPDKEKVIGIFNENNSIKKIFFNYANEQSSTLNSNIGFISFSPDSKKIAYQYTDPQSGQSNISIADPDGQNWKTIFKTRAENLIVEWPEKEKISPRTLPSGLAPGLLYTLKSNSGDFLKILSDKYGLIAKWSTKGDKILYSMVNTEAKNPKLFLFDTNNQQEKSLEINGLADKCVFAKDNQTIFCALPQEFSDNAIWPDDYYKGLIIVNDDFYKINLETGKKTKIAQSTLETGYDAQELFLSPQEDYLFFINRRDGLLYSLKL